MPWYTTADARRDAEKQAASKKRENTMSYTFEVGKSGAVKAIHELGDIEMVPHWTWHAMAFRQLIAERDQLRSQLAEYENAPTVAWQDVHEPQDLYCRKPAQIDARELIARKVKK